MKKVMNDIYKIMANIDLLIFDEKYEPWQEEIRKLWKERRDRVFHSVSKFTGGDIQTLRSAYAANDYLEGLCVLEQEESDSDLFTEYIKTASDLILLVNRLYERIALGRKIDE